MSEGWTFNGERRGSHIEAGGFMPTGRRGSHVEEIPQNPNVITPGDNIIRKASVTNPDFGGLQADSKDATVAETTMTVREALSLYKKGIFWSVLLSTAIVMEGYDTLLLGNFYALPSFLARFGDQTVYDATTGVTSKTISAPWRTGLGQSSNVGEIIGLAATGILQDRFGYKKTIGGALVAVTGLLFILFFAQSLGMLLAGEILCGIPWGVFQTITTAYASEVMPVKLRAYLTTYVNLCWVLGQIVATGVLRGMLNQGNSDWGWRIPYALQWMWPIPILIGCVLAPESPWWLVRHGRFEEAKHSLLRLTSPNTSANFNVDQTVAMMEHTTELEKEMNTGTSYWDCFKGTDLRRTEIVCLVWLAQQVCGSTFMGQSTVFYQDAGLAQAASFDMSIVQFCLGAIGTFLSWFAMSWFGRRTLYLYGSIILTLIMLIVGCLATRQDVKSYQWAIGTMLLIFTFCYDLTIGPVCYSLVAELSSTRLKAKSIVLSRNLYNIAGIVCGTITNYQLTVTAWDWRAYSGFFWCGTSALMTIWIFFRLPEPRGRTYGELDILFEHRISARKFASTNVDVFRGDTIAVVDSDEKGQPRRASVDHYKTVETIEKA